MTETTEATTQAISDDVTTVAVVGAGTMGRGIAGLFMRAGHDVRIHDHLPGVAARWVDSLSADELRGDDGRVRATDVATLEELVQDAGLVVEVVAEDRAIKASVLRTVSEHAPAHCIIATNTSSFPIDELAEDCLRPERFLGMHFFNPADVIPGVEVIAGEATDPAVVERVSAWLTAAGKRPATVRSSPGFIANRLQMALFLEAVKCVEEGLVTAADLDTVVSTSFGFRLPFFGPFAIADMAGLDVYRSIFATLQQGFGDRFAAPDSLVALTDQGHYGLKTGRGFRAYAPDEGETLVAARDDAYARMNDLLSDS